MKKKQRKKFALMAAATYPARVATTMQGDFEFDEAQEIALVAIKEAEREFADLVKRAALDGRAHSKISIELHMLMQNRFTSKNP